VNRGTQNWATERDSCSLNLVKGATATALGGRVLAMRNGVRMEPDSFHDRVGSWSVHPAAEDGSDYPSNIGRPTAKVPKCNKKGDESKNKQLFCLFARR
jgi:hypothetical protein